MTDNAPGQESTSDGATGSSSTHSATAVAATRKREKKPDIDYDAKIREAAAAIKEMSKAMAALRALRRTSAARNSDS